MASGNSGLNTARLLWASLLPPEQPTKERASVARFTGGASRYEIGTPEGLHAISMTVRSFFSSSSSFCCWARISS